jgi:hypothetical protein
MKDDMKKGLFLLLALCLAASLVFAALNNPPDKGKSVADQKAQTPAATDERPKPKNPKDMTPQELADGIAKVLDRTEEVMDYIPGLKQEKDPAGNGFYTYNGTKLEKLEKGMLTALYTRVRQERTRLNAERITKQLETIRNVQQATNIANQASRVPAVPARPPQTPSAQPPRTPPAPPQTRR